MHDIPQQWRRQMLAKLILAGGLMVTGLALAPADASAASAPQSTLPGATAASGTLVEKVHWRRCRAWRHECAARWGWRTPMFFRCLGRHGC
jgi:hypothetical protein